MAAILSRINDSFREQHPQHHNFVNTLLIVQLQKKTNSAQNILSTHEPLGDWRFKWNFGLIIFRLILVIHGWGTSLLNCTQTNVTGPYWCKSTLVQVMAWCHQATSHYLSHFFYLDLCHHVTSVGLNEWWYTQSEKVRHYIFHANWDNEHIYRTRQSW